MSDDELDAKKWRRFWTIFDQMGIYPAEYNGEKRTAYGEGWNDCQAQLLACFDILERFYGNIDPSLPDKIQKLDDDSILFFHFKKDGFMGEIELGVNCNDLFWWACADVEEISLEEIPALFNACYDENGYSKHWGASIWACLHRKMRPQHPIEDAMKEAGVWTDDLETLPVRENTG